MLIALIILFLLLIQPLLGEYINYFNQYEEVLIILLALTSFYKVIICKKQIKIKKYTMQIVVLLIIFLLIGIVSGLKSNLQSFIHIITSGILTIKVFIVYFLFTISFKFKRINIKVLNIFYKIVELIIFVNFCIAMLNIKFKFLTTYGNRFGIDSISIGFSHPAQLDFFMISLSILMLFLTVFLKKSMKRLIVNLLLAFTVIIFTGRNKAIIFFIAYYIFLLVVKFTKKIRLRQLMYITPIGVYIGYDRIVSEFLNENGPRGILMRTAIQILKSYFPLGAGFGSYGSHISRKFYSELYYKYRLNRIYGFSRVDPKYITDSQWASIIGETGIFGTIIYIGILIILTCYFYKSVNEPIYKIIISGLWIYGIIASISDTIFMGYRGIAIMGITIFMIAILKDTELNENL